MLCCLFLVWLYGPVLGTATLAAQPHTLHSRPSLPFLPPFPLPQAKEAAAAAGDAPGVGAGAELTLYRRMAEVKAMERLVAIEDLMYVCILEKFKVGGRAGRRVGALLLEGGRAGRGRWSRMQALSTPHPTPSCCDVG